MLLTVNNLTAALLKTIDRVLVFVLLP
jgi:hypothetical protein